MRFYKPLVCVLVLTFFLSGCAPTRYEKSNFFGRGYSDYRIGQNKFNVSFSSNTSNSDGEIMRLAQKRAAEVALANNFNYFKITSAKSSRRSGYSETRVIYLDICCFEENPEDDQVIDAHDFLLFNKT